MVIISAFPNSTQFPFLATSPPTTSYNCIAWAYSDPTRWYWPDPQNTYFWPANVPRNIDIPSFILLYESIGYAVCPNGSYIKGVEKIAIFSDDKNHPTHAARQLPSGFWTSKLGKEIDVQHTIQGTEGRFYGNVAVYMQRFTDSTFVKTEETKKTK